MQASTKRKCETWSISEDVNVESPGYLVFPILTFRTVQKNTMNSCALGKHVQIASSCHKRQRISLLTMSMANMQSNTDSPFVASRLHQTSHLPAEVKKTHQKQVTKKPAMERRSKIQYDQWKLQEEFD